MGSFDSADNKAPANKASNSKAMEGDGETAVIRPADIRRAAMDLLARREHSYQELQRKLCVRFADTKLVCVEIDRLREERLQSDERFAEAYLHSRAQRLYGPVRIRIELRERGISDALIATTMQQNEIDWRANLLTLIENKFGRAAPHDLKDKAKRLRFLQYRGFVNDDLHALFE